ncbi:hypothetical protein NPIL_264791 [Nephila pilipes]|uniref:Uncharacterized protein n=1 Tax=Nephila pilipes TaxID=299642 RepID=A0A8X6P085_NEPPI|nr:hypothetical protein NPIL_264791 [Nephila pilipes]
MPERTSPSASPLPNTWPGPPLPPAGMEGMGCFSASPSPSFSPRRRRSAFPFFAPFVIMEKNGRWWMGLDSPMVRAVDGSTALSLSPDFPTDCQRRTLEVAV